MWRLLIRLAGSALNALHRRRHTEVLQPSFFGGQSGYDTIVFVHGLHGNFKTTWAAFPELLRSDPDLPALDILLWSYRASTLPGAHSITVEAQHLMTGLRTLPASVEHIFLVGHSMGGLLILEGLRQELRAGRAKSRPFGVARHVTLYATPVLGSELASTFLVGLGLLGRLRYFASRQLEELRQGEFCNGLLSDVANSLYNPTIEPGSENHKCRIPITACVASDDIAVKPDSAAAIFQTPPVLRFPGDHSSIKEPESRDDLRYQALKRSLADHYSQWFSERAAAAQDGATGRWARLELESRCREALIARLSTQPRLGFKSLNEAGQRVMLREYLSLAIELAADRPGLHFGDVLNAALIAFSEKRG
jgi:pimeloyl-ACP methyl ester carboxylesterase